MGGGTGVRLWSGAASLPPILHPTLPRLSAGILLLCVACVCVGALWLCWGGRADGYMTPLTFFEQGVGGSAAVAGGGGGGKRVVCSPARSLVSLICFCVFHSSRLLSIYLWNGSL